MRMFPGYTMPKNRFVASSMIGHGFSCSFRPVRDPTSGFQTQQGDDGHASRRSPKSSYRNIRCQLAINRLSDNVGGVKYFSRTLRRALGEERHFALVDGLPFPTQARL
jgi:hypothetical protein